MGGFIRPASSVEIALRILLPGLSRLKQFIRQGLQLPGFRQAPDRRQLLLRSVHNLGGIGIVAVTSAVDFVFQLFFQLSLDNSHCRDRRAQQREKIRNEVALFKIQHIAPAPLGLLRIGPSIS